MTRKLPLEGGATVTSYLTELADIIARVRASNRPEFGAMPQRLTEALTGLQSATLWMALMLQSEPESALASATPFLRLMSLTAGGAYLAKGALAEDGASPRVALARFFAENLLPERRRWPKPCRAAPTPCLSMRTGLSSHDAKFSNGSGVRMSAEIEVSQSGGVQLLRIVRPEKKNALTGAMYAALADAIEASDSDASVAAHVIIGSGGVFTAGNDLGDFLATARGTGSLGLMSCVSSVSCPSSRSR